MKKSILLVGGSMNQTTQMHRIAGHLQEFDCFFSPFFGDGLLGAAASAGLLEFTILGKKRSGKALDYMQEHGLQLDVGGRARPYDLVVTCTDLIMPRVVRSQRVVLVQEGMTEPETAIYRFARRHRWLPRWVAGTAMTGLSHGYEKFCVASEGYADLFIAKGVDPSRIEVTGIPNFDDCSRHLQNDFPHAGYVLVCTSDNRETFIAEDRVANIHKWVGMAAGRQLLFKLHPNEHVERATREIEQHAPGSLVYSEGKTEEMIANASMLIAHYSSTILVASALGKEVHCSLEPEELRRLTPLQNGAAAEKIAAVCRKVVEG